MSVLQIIKQNLLDKSNNFKSTNKPKLGLSMDWIRIGSHLIYIRIHLILPDRITLVLYPDRLGSWIFVLGRSVYTFKKL